LNSSHGLERTELPLKTVPLEMFVGARPRRCAACGAVAIARVHGAPGHGFASAACGQPSLRGRSGTRCPWCTGALRDKGGRLACAAHCPAVQDVAREPRAAWEGALSAEGARAYPTEWGLAGGGAWDRYGGESRLQTRWGYRDEQGDVLGAEDERLERERVENTERIAEMAYALRAFARRHRELSFASQARLPRWYRLLAVETWAYYREVLGELAAMLVNALAQRGEPYDGITDRVHLRRARRTPFASYRHALGAALGVGNPEGPAVGRSGSTPLDRGVPYKHALPRGVQLGRMAVAPSRSGAAPSSREHGTVSHDAAECLAAARVGGTWIAAVWRPDGTPETPATCQGGYALSRAELRLLELVELGAPVMVRDGCRRTVTPDWAKLSLREALASIKAERDLYPEARHWTEGEARHALRDARAATLEAFEAWGLIPAREPEDEDQETGGDRISEVRVIVHGALEATHGMELTK